MTRPLPSSGVTVVEALSPDAARILTTHPRRFSIGEGLRLDLSLARGEDLRVLGLVRQIERSTASAEQRIELRFRGHGAKDRERLAASVDKDWIAGAATIRARISEKFALDCAGGRLSLSLVGALSEIEARALSELVADALAPRQRGRVRAHGLLVCIDATRFLACPESALAWMRRWLAQLARPAPMLGVLIGADSVGMMQLQRLVRAVGIAEHLVICCGRDEAERTLAAMARELDGGPR